MVPFTASRSTTGNSKGDFGGGQISFKRAIRVWQENKTAFTALLTDAGDKTFGNIRPRAGLLRQKCRLADENLSCGVTPDIIRTSMEK